MNLIIYFLQKTVGQKVIVGLTGLGLCLFVLIHMIGNLFILLGPEAYNGYANKLHEFPLFIAFEIGLLIFFLGHIVLSVLLFQKNRAARGEVYYQKKPKGDKSTSFIHNLIVFQAGVLFIFLIFHLISFKFGPYYETILEGQATRDIYRLVVKNFKIPFYTIGYSLALVVLFIHLLRGLTASFKTLGLGHPVYLFYVNKLALVFASVVTMGFLIPIWYVFIYL